MKTTKMLAILVLRSEALLRGVVLVLALGIVPMSLAAEATWTKKADMPTVRFDFSTSVVDGKIYAIGGRDQGVSGAVFPTVEEYDPAANTWTQKADMPTPRTGLATSVVDGKIYASGGVLDTSYGYGQSSGYPIVATVEAYDPATDTWTPKADMPRARECLSTAVVDGKIYAIGGMGAGWYTDFSAVEEYDPATDTWTPKADMPTARHWFSSSVVDGKIYAIGGKQGASILATVEEYEPATDTWTPKTNMPTARCGLSTSVVNGKIYAIGGWSGWSGAPPIMLFATVEEYDPATDTWTKKPDMPTARCHLSTSAVNWKIYAIGGSLGSWASFVATSVVEEYNPIPLVVDFNGDGIVDAADMCIMVDHWGENYPLCDIGPMPWGDGIVDVQDLIVLAEHLFTYPGAVAYWKLDETEGDIAYDSVDDNDGTLYGDPAWQPEGGMVYGALELDGINDYISTPFVLNPAEGKFSVFVWIKGGAPGQAVLSQIGGVNWLCADTLEGNLMTELKGTGRGAAAMLSQTVITDGYWHRIGLVWDGSYRTLYVDDIAVAEDAQEGLEPATGSLYIGTGTPMEAGTYWSGLIDDVRIYGRAISP